MHGAGGRFRVWCSHIIAGTEPAMMCKSVRCVWNVKHCSSVGAGVAADAGLGRTLQQY